MIKICTALSWTTYQCPHFGCRSSLVRLVCPAPKQGAMHNARPRGLGLCDQLRDVRDTPILGYCPDHGRSALDVCKRYSPSDNFLREDCLGTAIPFTLFTYHHSLEHMILILAGRLEAASLTHHPHSVHICFFRPRSIISEQLGRLKEVDEQGANSLKWSHRLPSIE